LQGYALYRQTGAWSNFAQTASVPIGRRATIDPTGTDRYNVTNIVAGTGTTRLPPASAGETLQVPVNSSGTTHIYDWETSTSAWVDVVPADTTGLTNRIEATVVFTSSYTQLTTNIIERPPTNTVVWPDAPVTTVSTGFQSLVRQTVANLAFAEGAYTNNPASTSFWTNHLTRLTGTNLQQIVQTNDVTLAVTTNAVPVVWTNDFPLASWTGAWVTVQNGLPPDTTTPVRVAWATTNLPTLFFSNYWTWVDSYGTTNQLDALADRQTNETFQAWQLAVNPIVDLTNFPWRLSYALTNTFFYPPPGASNSIPWMPLALDAYEVIEAAGNSSEWATQRFYGQTAVGTTPLLPAPAQQRQQWVETVITNQITGTRMVSVILETVTIAVTNRLTALVPASLVGTNRYYYNSGPAYRSGYNTVSDNATTWIPVVLQNDFEGADVQIYSLWLEPGQRSGQSFDYEPRNIYGLVGERGDDWDPPMTDPQLLLDGIAACYFQVLAFKEESGEPLLEPWSPGDTEPPVCIDIYLELIDPAIGRRAATMSPNESAAFIRRQVVRLTKRVPLQTHNRWRSP
jgi:hypothetical protein